MGLCVRVIVWFWLMVDLVGLFKDDADGFVLGNLLIQIQMQ